MPSQHCIVRDSSFVSVHLKHNSALRTVMPIAWEVDWAPSNVDVSWTLRQHKRLNGARGALHLSFLHPRFMWRDVSALRSWKQWPQGPDFLRGPFGQRKLRRVCTHLQSADSSSNSYMWISTLRIKLRSLQQGGRKSAPGEWTWSMNGRGNSNAIDLDLQDTIQTDGSR